MTKNAVPSRVRAEKSDVPIARLDAQDLEQALPIQEYLEQNGCAVVVNRNPAILAAYHIICGDLEFVQTLIASMGQHNTKPFIVLFLKKAGNILSTFGGINARIAVITGSAISTRDVSKLFAYFFSGDEGIFYLERDSRSMVGLRPIEEETESLRDDTRRQKRLNPAKAGFNLKKPGILRLVLLSVGILTAPIFWYLVSLTIVVLVQGYGVGALARGEVTRMGIVTSLTTYWVGQGGGALGIVAPVATMVGAGGIIRGQERVLSVIRDIVTVEMKTAEFIAQSSKAAPILLSGEGRSAGELSVPVIIERMRLALEGITTSLGLAGAELHLIASDGQFPFSIPFVRTMTIRAEAEIASALAQAGSIGNMLTLYRAVGGFDEKKTYLVILQNSMELRPTGGFIGSIALVTVEDGAILTPVLQDVYALDGQLKGHVDPPGPIKELLAQEHWYLRDSNWDPDFAVSGQKAAWFYEKETGQSVDGVVAISTPILTDLLGVTGPLDLVDYNDRITKENFFGKSLFYTKADFFPGSTQKKDFLGSLMVALLGRLTSGNPGDTPALLRVVSLALTAGDIQFWFPEGQAQAIARQAGWTGDIARSVPCETSLPPCTLERVAIVESNMGVNKVNSYIKRSVKTRVDLDEDGTVNGAIAITYQNTSTDDATISGGGTYLAHLRAFLPPDAMVLSALLDGVEIPGKSSKRSERTIPYRDTDETTNGSTVAGVAFTVPPGREQTITITYRRGTPLTFVGNESTLVFLIRKQPGTTDTTLDATIGYPVGWRSDVATGTFANTREVRYNTTLDQTKTFTVKFTK